MSVRDEVILKQKNKIQEMEKLFEYLKMYGGEIISSNKLQPMWIDQARASNRMWVDDNGFGFIWEPPMFKNGPLPETHEEVLLFEKWYPLEVPMPDSLKNLDIIKYIESRKKPLDLG